MSQSSEDFQWWKFVLQVTSCYLEVSRLEFFLTVTVEVGKTATRTYKSQSSISPGVFFDPNRNIVGQRPTDGSVSIQRGLPMVEVRTPSNKLLLGSVSIQRGLPMVEVRTPSNKLLLGSISPGVFFDTTQKQPRRKFTIQGLNPVSRLEFFLT